MCGISGVITKEILSPELITAVWRMSAAQIHRGPDGAGEFIGEKVALASRRLSIIDRENGWQPRYNADRSLVLIVNGEIYNYVELRDRLKKSGCRFRTATDGEVILHLYEENPEDFVSHLRGMFAFALWDEKRRRLILVRDRMGEKPLYIHENDRGIWFASELKSILSSQIIPFELDARAVNLYFHYQYVPEPFTAVKGVRKLDAGRMLIVDVEKWRVEEKTYWKMEDAPPLDGDPRELIREKLEEVSRLIVRSDVPVGVALSGGLDSSVVAAFAARQKSDLRAFSVGYAGRPESDERLDAEKLARHLKIPFHDVELDTQTIVEFFPELNYWRDDPIADIAGFGYYAVMKLARQQNVPVILQGQGGDELFWGYPQMRRAIRENLQKAALIQDPFLQNIKQTFDISLPERFMRKDLTSWLRDFGGIRSNRRRIKKHLASRETLIRQENLEDFRLAAEQIQKNYHPDFSANIRENAELTQIDFNGSPNFAEIALTEIACKTYLRENGIAQGDRLGMASSVEMRLPLVDYKFVETVIGLRKMQSDAKLPPKFWLKEAAKGVLPEWIFNRPKRGFAPPVGEWCDALFKAYGGSLRDGFLVESEILSRESGQILAQGDVRGRFADRISLDALVLEQWCRQMSKITARQND